MKRIIYLVNACNDDSISSIANDYSFAALNVLALGTWLEKFLPEMQIICRDAGILGCNSILNEIDEIKPWFVGISVLVTSYGSALKIAERAKQNNAFVTFGNDHASQLCREILQCREVVDYIIGAEYGEYPLELLIRKLAYDQGKMSEIPSLAYRNEKGDICGFDFNKDKSSLSILNYPILTNKKRRGSMDMFPITDRSLYPPDIWEKSRQNYMSNFGHLHAEKKPSGVTIMNRVRGCGRAGDNSKCKHCDMLLDIAFSSPSIFWEEVITANKQMGADLFYEVCDSLTSFPGYMKLLLHEKPTNLNFDPLFFIYAQSIDIVKYPYLVDIMKKMGVFKVNIGLESGSDFTLKNMKGQRDSVSANLFALKKMKDAGIYVYSSFVLGTEFESYETLDETLNWIKMIIDENLVSDVEAQPIMPEPNNFYGKKMMNDGMLLHDGDWPLDIDIISENYINKYSSVSYSEVVAATKEIREYASQRAINFGSAVSKLSNYIV